MTAISFSPHSSISVDDRGLISKSSLVDANVRFINEQQTYYDKPKVDSLVVDTAKFIGLQDRRQPIIVHGFAFREKNLETSQEVNFWPDNTTLLVVFRVLGKHMLTPDAHHVLSLRHSWMPAQNIASFGMTRGIFIDCQTQPSLDIIPWVKKQPLEKLFWLNVPSKYSGKFSVDPDEIFFLGYSRQAFRGGPEYQYATEIKITPPRFEALTAMINQATVIKRAGCEPPRLVTLDEAYAETLEGYDPAVFHAVARYKQKVLKQHGLH